MQSKNLSLVFRYILQSLLDRYNKGHWIKLQEMNCNVFSTLLALLVLSICHLIEVIVTRFQEWPDRPVVLVSSCALTLTATQHHVPGGVRKYPEERTIGSRCRWHIHTFKCPPVFLQPIIFLSRSPWLPCWHFSNNSNQFISLSVRLSSSWTDLKFPSQFLWSA